MYIYIYKCICMYVCIHTLSNSPTLLSLSQPPQRHCTGLFPFCQATSAPRMPSSSHMNCPVQSLRWKHVARHGSRLTPKAALPNGSGYIFRDIINIYIYIYTYISMHIYIYINTDIQTYLLK